MKKIVLATIAMLLVIFTGCNAKDSNGTNPEVIKVNETTKVESSDKKNQEELLVTLKTNQGDIVLKMFSSYAKGERTSILMVSKLRNDKQFPTI